MLFRTFVARTETFLRSAARIACRQKLDLTFSYSDLGDFYHVHGVSATPAKFVSMLKARNAQKT
jgi:hypothetical protein